MSAWQPPEVRDLVRGQIVRRLLPADRAQFFSFAPRGWIGASISCYDSAVGGHFLAHRDNVNAGAEHRRFAVSIQPQQQL